MKKKKKSISLPPTHKTLYFPSFLLLSNAVMPAEDIKVVQFKRKFHYIIPGRKSFTTYKNIDNIRIKSKSIMLRKRKITVIKIVIVYFFQNIFSDSSFSSTFFLFLATPCANILFYCFDLYQAQFQISKTSSTMLS